MTTLTAVQRAFLSFLICTCLTACGETDCEIGEKRIRSNEFSEGIDLMSRCLSRSNLKRDERVQALQIRSWAYYSLRQDIAAVADLEASFKLRAPADYREFINYGSSLRRVRRFDDSLKALQAAERIDSSSMMTRYNLGWTFFELGRYDEAIKNFNQGIPMQPDYPFVYWRRGLSFEKLNQKKDARRDFEVAAQLILESKEKWGKEDLAGIREKLKDYGLQKKYPI